MQVQFTLATLPQAVQQCWNWGHGCKVWAFHGEMGAGKTTFIHALCTHLEVTSTVGSPTYAIINEYGSTSAGTIYHMDWYRMKDEEEAMQAGVEDALYSGKLCLVEWPDRALGLLPANTLHVYISTASAEERLVRLELVE